MLLTLPRRNSGCRGWVQWFCGLTSALWRVEEGAQRRTASEGTNALLASNATQGFRTMNIKGFGSGATALRRIHMLISDASFC